MKVRQNGISCDLLNTLSDFLSNRKQRVVLNGQTCSWANITAGVPKESILGPVLFLIYVNDLPDCLIFIVKLLSDGTSLFSVVHDISVSAKERNEDLNFNPDPSKQAQQLLFRRKLQKVSHPKLLCNNADVSKTNSQKHFGLIIDSKLIISFQNSLTMVMPCTTKLLKVSFRISWNQFSTIRFSHIWCDLGHTEEKP